MLGHVLLLLLGLEHNYSIPTSSMQPTLYIGDVLPMRTYRVYTVLGPSPLVASPQRGDLIAFWAGEGAAREVFLKRIVGLPGERVQMREGRLYIEGTEVPRASVGQFTDTDSFGDSVPVTRYSETLPGGVEHLINEISDEEWLDNTAEYVVPAGRYFMMGDNRDRSADSRVLNEVGYVSPDSFEAMWPSAYAPYLWNTRQ